jgi:septum formation topological specificity factor MinE
MYLLDSIKNLLQIRSKDRSADVAIDRLNQLLSKLPNIKQLDLEKFKKDLLYFLNMEYNIDTKDVLFSVNESKVTIQTTMPTTK